MLTKTHDRFFRKLAKAPGLIQWVPAVLSLVVIVRVLPYRWNLICQLFVAVFFYTFTFVQFTTSSKRPSRSKLLVKRILLAIAVVLQALVFLWIWTVPYTAQTHSLSSLRFGLGVVSFLFLMIEWFFQWP